MGGRGYTCQAARLLRSPAVTAAAVLVMLGMLVWLAAGCDGPSEQTRVETAELEDGEHFGFLTAFTPTELTFDPAEVFGNEEATAAAIEDGELAPGEELPNPFYVRNPDPTTVDLPVATNFEAQLIHNIELDHQLVTADDLAALYDGTGDASWVLALLEHIPVDLTVEDGEVIRIVQHYLP